MPTKFAAMIQVTQYESSFSLAQAASTQEVDSLKEQVADFEQQQRAEAAQHEETVQTQRAELAQHAQRVSELEAEVAENDEARVKLEEEYGYALQEAGQREDALKEELAASQVSHDDGNSMMLIT